MDRDQHTIEQGEHVVQFYEREETLALAVAGFLGGGLLEDETAIVVATPDHRAAFEAVLVAAGVDLTRARGADRYIARDAAEILADFMVDGTPDASLFLASVGSLVTEAAARGPVRIYAETVSLLWDDANVLGAMALEQLWNDLAQRESFALFCAYSKHSMAHRDGDEQTVCGLHSSIVPEPGPFPAWTDQAIRRFEPTSAAPAAARRFVREVLASWDYERFDEVAELVISELATNAATHTGQRFVVSLARDAGALVMAVRDHSSTAPQRRPPTDHALSGRGLHIVAGLAARWGTEHHDDGKTVWAQLAPR